MICICELYNVATWICQAINRTLLKWLKLWDKVVFNRDKKQTSQKDVKQKQGKAGWNKKYSKNALENEEWNVSYLYLYLFLHGKQC